MGRLNNVIPPTSPEFQPGVKSDHESLPSAPPQNYKFFGESISVASQSQRAQKKIDSISSGPIALKGKPSIAILSQPLFILSKGAFGEEKVNVSTMEEKIASLQSQIKSAQQKHGDLTAQISPIKTTEDSILKEEGLFWKRRGIQDGNPSKIQKERQALISKAKEGGNSILDQINAIENKLKQVREELKPLGEEISNLNHNISFFQKSIQAYQNAKAALLSLAAFHENDHPQLMTLYGKQAHAYYELAQDHEKAVSLDVKSDLFKKLEKKIEFQKGLLVSLSGEVRCLSPEYASHPQAKSIQALWSQARKKYEYLAQVEEVYFSTKEGQRQLSQQLSQLEALKNAANLQERAAGFQQKLTLQKRGESEPVNWKWERTAFSKNEKNDFLERGQVEEQIASLHAAQANVENTENAGYRYQVAPSCLRIATQLVNKVEESLEVNITDRPLEYKEELLEMASVLEKIATLDRPINTALGEGFAIDADLLSSLNSIMETLNSLFTFSNIESRGPVGKSRPQKDYEYVHKSTFECWIKNKQRSTYTYSVDPSLIKQQKEILEKIPSLLQELQGIYLQLRITEPNPTTSSAVSSSLDIIKTRLSSLTSRILEAKTFENNNQARGLNKAREVLLQFSKKVFQSLDDHNNEALESALAKQDDYLKITDLFEEAARASFFGEYDKAKALEGEATEQFLALEEE
ncbi:MAG: hypothetical protein K2W99_00710 [Chthoniobacterales bacterium]|nr:hypothetical protein [Chthoniobacterales bacterium]